MELKWKGDCSPHMQIKTNHGVPCLTYPAFEQLGGFYHGFSTRLGGVSKGALPEEITGKQYWKIIGAWQKP